MSTNDQRQEAFAEAARRHLEPRGRQVEVAEKMGVPPTTLNGWVTGRRAIGVEEAIELERALDLEPGRLTIHLGFLPPDARDVTIASSEEAIIADNRLSGRQKRTLLDLLDQLAETNE